MNVGSLNRPVGFLERLRQTFSGGLTVIDFDGLRLQVAVVRSDPRLPQIVASTVAEAAAGADALAPAVATLRAQGARLPRRTVLVTAQATPGLVAVPVAPDRARKAAQMRALLAPGAAPLAAAFAQAWRLGAVLQALGVLNAEQRAAIAAEQTTERTATRRPPTRFGEVAERLGFAQRSDVERALALLPALQTTSGRVALGFAALPGQTPAGPAYDWLVAGIDAAVRDQWRAACAAAGLRLAAIHPRAGQALAAWPQDASVFLIERNHDQLAQTWRRGARLQLLQVDTPAALDAQTLRTHLRVREVPAAGAAAPPTVFAVLGDAGFAAAAAQAADLPLAAAAQALGSEASPVILGAAAAATGARPRLPLPAIAPREQVQWRKHPDFSRLALPAAALALALAVLGGMGWRLAAQQQRLEDVRHQGDSDVRMRTEVEARGREAAKLKADLDRQRAEAAKLANRAALLDEGMLQRGMLLPALLRTLAAAIPPSVVLDAVEEPKMQGGFRVSAWSIDVTALNAFAGESHKQLAKLGLGVLNLGLEESKGRSGALGYRATFWIVGDPDALLGSASTPPPPAAAAPRGRGAAASPAPQQRANPPQASSKGQR